jgi:hypothetical protein
MWKASETDRDCFSDVYKSDYGFRPNLAQWSDDAIDAWFDARPTLGYDSGPLDAYQDEVACGCCCCTGECYDGLNETEDEGYTGLASEYQEGWA